jgi:hypothetical protein
MPKYHQGESEGTAQRGYCGYKRSAQRQMIQEEYI